MSKFLKLIKNEEGATAIEYGLIAALIAVACIGALSSVGTNLSAKFNTVATNIKYGSFSVLFLGRRRFWRRRFFFA